MNFKTLILAIVLLSSSAVLAQSQKVSQAQESVQSVMATIRLSAQKPSMTDSVKSQYEYERLMKSLPSLDSVLLYQYSLAVQEEQSQFPTGAYANRLKMLSRRMQQELYSRKILTPELGYERSDLPAGIQVGTATLNMCYLKHPSFQLAMNNSSQDLAEVKKRAEALRGEYLKSPNTFKFCYQAILDHAKASGNSEQVQKKAQRTREISRVIQSYNRPMTVTSDAKVERTTR